MDILQAMKTFVAVVETGGFIKAVDVTGFSKPAVSRQVADLEKYLGARLLHRTTRRVSLTDEGRSYYQHSKAILLAVEEAHAEVSDATLTAQGNLRIGAPQTFGALHLAPLWGRFAAENPSVDLDIVLSDRVVDMVEEGYDLVVRIGRLTDSNLVSRALATSRMVLCASPDYLANHGVPLHPDDLAQHEVIAYSYWSAGDEWSFLGLSGETRVRVSPRIHANSGDTCKAAAVAGYGVVFQPDFLVYDCLQTGQLIELMPEFQGAKLEIQTLYPTRKQLPLKVRKLVDFLVEQFRHPVWTQE